MESPQTWALIWLVVAVVFALGELSMAGSFFLIPFAIGAAVAAILSIVGAPVPVGWAAFLVVSLGSFLALRPLSKRLDAEGTDKGVGANRLIGESGQVIEAIAGGGDLGLVRIGREKWRAEVADQSPLAIDTYIEVTEVRGTRVIVWPAGVALPPHLQAPST
jgi:membrane protein implicated in regulation of membrane protease activity